jgi:hypothetical protein
MDRQGSNLRVPMPGSAAILSFTRRFGNDKFGVNLPFKGKYLSKLVGSQVTTTNRSFVVTH